MSNHKVDILAIGVHPDDVELSCSGTILKHISLGHKVAIVDMTRGELGTRGSGEIRLEEAAAAGKIMGVSHRENLGMRDGYFEHNEKNTNSIIKVIRKYQPNILLANAISDRHPDHGRAAKLIADASFYAGLIKIKTEDNGISQDPWRPKAVYHYIQDNTLDPQLIVDVSGFLDKKLESIMAYKTQFFDPNSSEPKTPISSKAFLDILTGRMQMWGRTIGAEYGEGYNVARTPGVGDLTSLL